MANRSPPPGSESSEEGRALLSVGIGAVGAIVKPGAEMVVGVAQVAQVGIFWWLARRGQRSVRYSHVLESSGLLLNVTTSAWLGRFVVGAFAREHSFVTSEGALMTDAYILMLHVAGIGLLLAVRAALVPSSPRRTAFVTAIVGAPLVMSTFLVATTGAGLAVRALDSSAYPWLPATAAKLWVYVIITCAIISWVIYGLRVEVREAQRLGQYVLEQKVGEGGMGEVYRARHGMMRRPSALKLMRATGPARATSFASSARSS